MSALEEYGLDEYGMLSELLDLLEEHEERFTEWEAGFIEDLDQKLNGDGYDITDAQYDKLQEIYETRTVTEVRA